ncbi:SDR family oxidoreductase [Calothrix sp. FACHB-1219]|uniref:SDR family oxidoreductase n=1 Tax=unclassified Calothrix TaxID=2619626 RepID=UPI0016862F85|nr:MULTISPECIES: SDR family oxidoreductase [unclassified Calothrix]MBD2203583.1 SDR family oxidoreductase [Calothrix sp. FACHB-168]MBD2221194.1 SDR family oxidoreductase [Calothrix sp. FACHB-1219]
MANIDHQISVNRPLSSKVAIVTGSSRGIGRAIAERLGQDGANVVVTYIGNEERAQEVVSKIQLTGAEAIAVQVDLRKIADVRSLFQKTLNHFGKVDILVNNAAGKNLFKPTAEMNEEEYDSMFDITKGVYFALQEAARHLADGGRIVSISTGGTSMALPAAGAYTGSKAAIEQFSKALAKEVGVRGITVNTVAPGVTETDGLVLNQEQVNHLIDQTPLGRLGKPSDIASTVALIVSQDAHWITGQNIRATGGIV